MARLLDRACLGERHIPIIAMTAHAMAEDRARCLANGMDGYISKPLRSVELTALLGQWLPKEEGMTFEEAQGTPLDRSYLAGLCGGDTGFEQELLEEYLRSAPKMVTRCQMMLEMEDATGLQHWAHTLKSSCRTVGALALAEQCQSLENWGEADRLTDAVLKITAFTTTTEAARVQTCVRTRLDELKKVNSP